MVTRQVRKIIKIDEEKCNGCGLCVPSCAEGALQIIDGKAKLVSEQYCDGLGACLGECPQDALHIEEREAEEFDEEAVEHYLESKQPEPCNCPSAAVSQFEDRAVESRDEESAPTRSRLSNWPVQLTLVPPSAPFLKGADLLLAADCVPFAHADFHRDLLQGHALLIACPKLDDFPAHLGKLAQVLRQAKPKSITVAHMEVPCCSGLTYMAQKAIEASGEDIPLHEITIGVRGEKK